MATEYNNQSNPSTSESLVTAMHPAITSLSPTSGAVGASVTITGTSFGATRGLSTVKFNGTVALTTGWSNTQIQATVPAGATTGPVLVTVNGAASNGLTFTVNTGSNGYSFNRAITISHAQVPNTDQTNFPLLVSGTYSYLATTANSGNVTSANGYDIIFTSDAAGTNALAFEQESYNGTTGAVNFWIKIPTLSHTTDTVIYMFYGNSAVTTDPIKQDGRVGQQLSGVWHLPNGSDALRLRDSTSNGNNLTQQQLCRGGSGNDRRSSKLQWCERVSLHSNTGQFDPNAWTWDGWIKPSLEFPGRPHKQPLNYLESGKQAGLANHFLNVSFELQFDWFVERVERHIRGFPRSSQNNWYHSVFTYNNGRCRAVCQWCSRYHHRAKHKGDACGPAV